MKVSTRNILTSALAIYTLGTMLSAQAAAEATVNITATVVDTLSVNLDKSTIKFDTSKLSDSIKITTTNNTPAKITVTAAQGNGNYFNLTQKSTDAIYPVKAIIKENTEAKFEAASNMMTHSLSQLGVDTVTTLDLTAEPVNNQRAGTYEGSLVIKIEKS